MALHFDNECTDRLRAIPGVLDAGQGSSIPVSGGGGTVRFVMQGREAQLGRVLYGVKPSDWATFSGVALVLLLVAVVACAVPARRSMQVDLIVALRYE